jgi:glutathione synthase/RimK-type ligase-like ATP-grasp enzyme
VQDVARRCCLAFGLTLFGLDIAEEEGALSLIDINYFPGYRGVPDAPRRLAEHILKVARG